jgi:hypothetical protein
MRNSTAEGLSVSDVRALCVLKFRTESPDQFLCPSDLG